MLKKEEFQVILNELQSKLGMWQLEIEKEQFADFIIGCFWDKNEHVWKVYINNERGRHRIRFYSESEDEAFDELLSIVNFEIENNNFLNRI